MQAIMVYVGIREDWIQFPTCTIFEMTLEAFEDAVSKGKGSAILCLDSADPAPYVDVILHACLHNLQFDRQCEGRRAPYLLWLVDRGGLAHRVLDAILEALPTADDWDGFQIHRLLLQFCLRGEERAWQALMSLAKTGDEDAQDLLAEAGARGVNWLAENILDDLPQESTYRAGSWLDQLEESMPEEVAAVEIRNLERLRLKAAEYQREVVDKLKPKAGPKTAHEAIDQLEATKVSGSTLARFALTMTDEELLEVANRFLAETNVHKARKYGRVFQQRAFPLDLRLLMERGKDKVIGGAYLQVLGRMERDDVRLYARELLSQDPPNFGALEALEASFTIAEIPCIRAALPSALLATPFELHRFILDLLPIVRMMPEGERLAFREWIYDHSSCSYCRSSAVRDMAADGSLPLRIAEEGRWDAETETRELAQSAFHALIPRL